MKNLLLIALLATMSTSCLSSKARDNALLPAALLAWGSPESGVQSDVLRGVADAVEDGDLADRSVVDGFIADLDAALEQDEVTLALRSIPWSTLEPFGMRGIQDRVDDGEMHPLVAESLYERMRNFGVAFADLVAYEYVRPRERWLSDGSQVAGGRVVSLNGTSHPTQTLTPIGQTKLDAWLQN